MQTPVCIRPRPEIPHDGTQINKVPGLTLLITIVDHVYIGTEHQTTKPLKMKVISTRSNLLSELFHYTTWLNCMQIRAGLYVFDVLFRSCVNECVEVTMSGSSSPSCFF